MAQFRIFMILALAACAAPLASVALSSWMAHANGCRLDEGDAHPCIVMAVDIGQLLYGMNLMGWLMIATIPLGAILLLGWILTEAVQFFRRRRAAAHS